MGLAKKFILRKKEIMKINFILIGIIGLILCVSCSNELHKRCGMKFPDCISPVYYLDTIQIESPIVIVLKEFVYLIPEKYIDKINFCSDSLKNSKYVIRYNGYYHDPRYGRHLEIYKKSNFGDVFLGENFSLWSSRFLQPISLSFIPSEIEAYKFKYKPESFLLMLISTEAKAIYRYIPGLGYSNDDITHYEYSRDYVLAAMPTFNKKTRKIILKKMQETENIRTSK